LIWAIYSNDYIVSADGPVARLCERD